MTDTRTKHVDEAAGKVKAVVGPSPFKVGSHGPSTAYWGIGTDAAAPTAEKLGHPADGSGGELLAGEVLYVWADGANVTVTGETFDAGFVSDGV